MAKLPLEGIRVIDGGDIWATPYGCTLLGDMGAEVIKIENTRRMSNRGQSLRPPPDTPGYPNKDPGERPWERSATFNMVNRNQKGVTIDITQPEGKELYKRLVKVSDVLVENFAFGVIERLGLGYNVLKEVNPQLIMISMPLFGNSGPYAGYRGMGSTADPLMGHTSIRCYEDNDPGLIGQTVHSDAISACLVVFLSLAALHYRRRTGKGQWIDFGQAEGFLPALGESIMDYTMNGRIAESHGNRHSSWAPHNAYQCQGDDRWVTITCTNDEEWWALVEIMGRPSWAFEERFSDSISRWKNQGELDKLITSWTKERDHYEVFHMLQAAGVPAGPVLDIKEVYEDPHIQQMGFFEEATKKWSGTYLYPGMQWKLTKTPNHIRTTAPCLGEHNDYVFGEVMGLSRKELADLEEKNVIGTVYQEGADQT